MKDESRNKWHQRRGSHPIDYIDLDDLQTIVRANERLFFPDIFPDKEWFSQFMREFNASRCVVCHMNPLDKTNIRALRVQVEKWQKQVKASLPNIP